jgi:hypothetical protein
MGKGKDGAKVAQVACCGFIIVFILLLVIILPNALEKVRGERGRLEGP